MMMPIPRGLRLALTAAVLAGLALTAWGLAGLFQSAPPSDPDPLAATPGVPWFVDVAGPSGITFRHFDPATPMHYIHETLGSGLGWIDYNNDGWPDLFVVQDGPVPLVPLSPRGRGVRGEGAGGKRSPLTPDPSPPGGEGRKRPPPTHKPDRNNGDGTFTDVTEEVGLARGGFGMGCAVGDYDNDGWDDLVVTYLGGVVLYHNEPDGKGGRRFVDVTAKAGLRDPHWATSCAWGDVDGD